MKKYISLLALCSLIFVSSQAQEKEKPYGNNLLTVSPLMIYVTPQISDAGVGIAYERFVNDYISVKVPLNFGLTNSLVQGGAGLKFYPTKHRGTVRYAVEPSFLYSRSTNTDNYPVYSQQGNYLYSQIVENNLSQLGFALMNSLNITVQKNIYMGLEMGLGINYFNNYDVDPQIFYPNNNPYYYQDDQPDVLFKFGVSLGYRF